MHVGPMSNVPQLAYNRADATSEYTERLLFSENTHAVAGKFGWSNCPPVKWSLWKSCKQCQCNFSKSSSNTNLEQYWKVRFYIRLLQQYEKLVIITICNLLVWYTRILVRTRVPHLAGDRKIVYFRKKTKHLITQRQI